MKEIKVKANSKLFYDWIDLGEHVKILSVIVQNDMDLQEDQIEEWKELCMKAINKIDSLAKSTLKYVQKG